MSDNQSIEPDIGLLYFEGTFTSEELTVFKRNIEAVNLSFASHSKHMPVMASSDAFTPFVRIILSPDFLAAISAGVISAIAWDAIKAVIKKINDAVMSKHPRKLSKGNVEDVREPIHIVVGNTSIILPSWCRDEIIIHSIDMAFEHITDTQNKTTTFEKAFMQYDEKTDCFKDYTKEEISHQEIKETKQDTIEDVVLP